VDICSDRSDGLTSLDNLDIKDMIVIQNDVVLTL